MKRKTTVLVVSATNSMKRRNRAGFKFTGDARGIMVTIDRRLAIEADSDLKVYRATSDQFKRATGEEEMPHSVRARMNEAIEKMHTTVIADVDYMRSDESIKNELEMIGEEGIAEIAEELKLKEEKGTSLKSIVADALLELEAEPAENVPEKMKKEKIEEEEDEEEEDQDDGEEEEVTEEAVQKRFKELDKMKPNEREALLVELGFEIEGDKAGQIVAILVDEFGEEVESMPIPEVTEEEQEEEKPVQKKKVKPAAKKKAVKSKK